MTSDKAPITIKKYANRRLYNTGTSAYVTLEDLAEMVKIGQDFLVYDAKTGDDITRAVLGQIIFEQETKSGQSLLPTTFLRQLIRFYGSSMQMLVPSYLEFSLDKLTKDQSGYFEECATAFGNPNMAFTAARPVFAQLEEQTRKNMAMFRQALAMFPPFGTETPKPNGAAPANESESPVPSGGQERDEFDSMKRQLEALQRRIEELAPKG